MRRIAVLAPFTSYPSFYERLSGILDEASEAGLEVSVFDHESAATASTPLLASMPIRGQIDGLIVMGQSIEANVEERLHRRSIPTVVIDAKSEHFPTVSCDDLAGGALVADYLLEQGHRRFQYVVERQASSYESQAVTRLEGFRARIAGRADTELSVVESMPSAAAVRDRVQHLFADGHPTSVVAHDDEMAVGVLQAARDLGLAVPRDLSVIGYDDSPIAAATELTTVAQPFRESGVVGARLLLSEIAAPGQPRTDALLDVRLVPRGTVAQPLSTS